MPAQQGRPTTLDNLVLQCPNCSLRKSDRVVADDPDTGQQVPLFHPLLQSWEQHFQLRPDGVCVGLTPVGRATVAALQMNATIPRFARACQIMLGLLSAG